jgi:hypothetical protein
VTLRARWVTLRARWVTLRACWVTFTGESDKARREFLIAMRRMSEQRDTAEAALMDDRLHTAACVSPCQYRVPKGRYQG